MLVIGSDISGDLAGMRGFFNPRVRCEFEQNSARILSEFHPVFRSTGSGTLFPCRHRLTWSRNGESLVKGPGSEARR